MARIEVLTGRDLRVAAVIGLVLWALALLV